jgi:hypothetical protein
MPWHNKHIIQKQTIEISFENPGKADGLQNRVAEVFYEKLQPRMEVLFDEMFDSTHFASIGLLDIECNIPAHKNWEDQWVEATLSKLKAELLLIKKKDFLHQEMAEETFLFFLEHGLMPWNSRISTIEELEKHINLNGPFLLNLKKLILHSIQASERLVYQFTEKFYRQIIDSLIHQKSVQFQNIDDWVGELKELPMDRRATDAILIRSLADDSQQTEKIFLQTLYQKTSSILSTSIKTDIPEPNIVEVIEENQKRQNTKPDSEPIYISNAGLCILHPFLPQLFREIKLTNEHNTWVDETAQHKATLVLEFLATGNTEYPEFALSLNKILAGIEIQAAIKAENLLSDATRASCEDLLTAVIDHWSILKNTSIGGLRETFLKRDGKLSRVDNGWLLQVEQKSIDVLLNSLPWGIGIVKLPWMNEIQYVDWI